MTLSRFPCTACGACCRWIGMILEAPRDEAHPVYRQALEEFPYKARPDGSCEMLGPDNRCTVYETRPAICNIETMIQRTGFDRLTRFRANAMMCNMMQEQAGIDPSYRVIIPEE